jgi:hypothetical protein
LFVVWVGALFAGRWGGVDGHGWSPFYWVFIGVGFGVYLILLGSRILATFGDASRSRDELGLTGQEWIGFFVLTGGLLIMGPWWAFDGNPSTNPLIGGIGSLIGLASAVLFVRHMLKPVRRGGGPASPWRAKSPW